MFRSEDIEAARKIVSALDLPENIGEDEEIEYVIERQLENVIEEDYYVTSGVSKVVIVIESLPFVIKIPFNGYWHDYDCGDEEEIDRGFEHFTGANEIFPDDYCFDELQKTLMIEERGFGMFAPHMELLCTIDDRSFYIQGRAQPLCDSKRNITPSVDSMQKAKNYCLSFVDEWIALAIDYYGEEIWNEFVQWGTENHLFGDMHTANYGIDMAGRPVIFDISGFRE